MDIPVALVEEVKRGRAVLLLGAGSSLAATNSHGKHPPDSGGLARVLAERFLGSDYSGMPLQMVAELAITESDIVTVQEYLRELFSEFEPTPSHRMLPTFRWHGLATTNYDLLVERAYDSAKTPAQKLVPFRSDEDRTQDLLKSGDSAAYLKLHGCITRTTDQNVPLILTPEQYVTHRRGRERLFKTLKEWGSEHPIVFIGSGMQDIDIRQVLLELSELGASRPKYYLVMPDAPDAVCRFWESRRVSILKGTFEDFVSKLDSQLPSTLRAVSPVTTVAHPISDRFSVRDAVVSPSCLDFLTFHAEYIHSGTAVGDLSPRDFFRGINEEWAAVEQNLDVRRGLVDTLLTDVVLEDEGEGSSVQLHVIKAEAGAGKTICLRRVAWDAARTFGRLCLWLKEGGTLSFDSIAEVSQATRERIFLFVDNAGDHVDGLQEVIRKAKREGLALTVFTAERVNQWNMACEELEPIVSAVHRLPYLRHSEIEELVRKLEESDSLGKLSDLSYEDRINTFEKRAGRQLLVALHEATHGKPFEEILVDEYNEIEPISARILYLSVCVLNRLGVPVRAGLIARVHSISFTDFREKLFLPLEHVVSVRSDPMIKDHLYAARHPLIAGIVFERILTDPNARYDEYSRLVVGLNLSYETDRSAFFQLMRARVLLELFPDHQAVEQLYERANEIAANESFVYHQQGIYEMLRPNGNLAKAAELLGKARSLTRRDSAILHSMAELDLKRAESAATDLESQHYRQQARRIAAPLTQDPYRGSYGYHTLLKLAVSGLKKTLAETSPSQREIDVVIQEAEDVLERGLQRFPGDEYLLAAEAELAKVLRDDERVLEALQKAFAANRRSPFIARGLAKALKNMGRDKDALRVLEEALEANPGERRLHFAISMLLHELNVDDFERILFHLRRGFAPGDNNYEAQFWYAHYLYMRGSDDDRTESRKLFKIISSAPLPHGLRTTIRAVFTVPGSTKAQLFTGRIARVETSYGFIERDGPGDWIFMHQESFGSEDWQLLSTGQLVNFKIGFNFFGPVGIEVSRP